MQSWRDASDKITIWNQLRRPALIAAGLSCGGHSPMPLFSFEVSSGPLTVARQTDVELADRRAVWDRVVHLARTTKEPGARLIVRDAAGETIVSIGLWTVRNLVRKPDRAA
jgi:hypothetical protein